MPAPTQSTKVDPGRRLNCLILPPMKLFTYKKSIISWFLFFFALLLSPFFQLRMYFQRSRRINIIKLILLSYMGGCLGHVESFSDIMYRIGKRNLWYYYCIGKDEKLAVLTSRKSFSFLLVIFLRLMPTAQLSSGQGNISVISDRRTRKG